tara:strand:+ start:349 stop:498 length:150 start_codon:yes stop_codon:yes gene_type:complete
MQERTKAISVDPGTTLTLTEGGQFIPWMEREKIKQQYYTTGDSIYSRSA